MLGEGGVQQLLSSTIEASVAMGAVKKTAYRMVIVDNRVQEKAIAHPTNSRLLEIDRHKVLVWVHLQMALFAANIVSALRRPALACIHSTRRPDRQGLPVSLSSAAA